MMPLYAALLEMDERSCRLGSRRFHGGEAMVNAEAGGGKPSTRILRCRW